MPWPRNIYSLVLICSLVLPSCITAIWFQGQIYLARESAKSHIMQGNEKKVSITLKFSIADAGNLLEWEHEKEFEYKGEMYDVIALEYFSDSIAYQCYHDKKETVLKNDFEDFISDFLIKQQPTEQQRQHKIDFFKTLYFIDDQVSSIQAIDSKRKHAMNHYLIMNYDFVFGPPAPPPRSSC